MPYTNDKAVKALQREFVLTDDEARRMVAIVLAACDKKLMNAPMGYQFHEQFDER